MAEKAKFDREAAFKSIIGAERQSENAVVAEAKNAKRNNDRVQRAYYLDRDLDKALRRMALEEGKNLTESVNDALRAGLTKYLQKQEKIEKAIVGCLDVNRLRFT